MSLLPYSNFNWMTKDQFENIDWATIDTETEIGYVLEVDLEYPKTLHDLHSNFPLAPETMIVEFDDLSPYSQSAYMSLEKQKRYKDQKLLATFDDREKYVVHFKNLKLYLQLGLVLTNVHRVVSFTQKRFIAPFIEKCTNARQMSKTKFEQDQFKKLANCVYGKTIQNGRKYIEVDIHNKGKSLERAIASPTYKNYSIIAEDLVQTNHCLSEIKHDKPIYAGFTILELSKHFMFDFFYNKLMKGSKFVIDLGMSDTDSFLFKVDNSKAFHAHIEKYMDYSNYPPDHPKFNLSNKARLGFFKDELAGKAICSEFVGLKSKCYAMSLQDKLSEEMTEKKVCKGLGRLAIKNRLKFEHYKNCLYKSIPKRFDFQTITSKKHSISTMRLNKRVITHFDSKRWIYSCGIHSDPYLSFNIQRKKPSFCAKCLLGGSTKLIN